MNFIEAVQALNDGKYIRSVNWPKDEYLFSSNGSIFDKSNSPSGFDNLAISTEWELYDKRLLNEDDFGYSIDRWLDCTVKLYPQSDEVNGDEGVYDWRSIDKLRLEFYNLLMYTYKQDKKKAVEFLDGMDNL